MPEQNKRIPLWKEILHTTNLHNEQVALAFFCLIEACVDDSAHAPGIMPWEKTIIQWGRAPPHFLCWQAFDSPHAQGMQL